MIERLIRNYPINFYSSFVTCSNNRNWKSTVRKCEYYMMKYRSLIAIVLRNSNVKTLYRYLSQDSYIRRAQAIEIKR